MISTQRYLCVVSSANISRKDKNDKLQLYLTYLQIRSDFTIHRSSTHLQHVKNKVKFFIGLYVYVNLTLTPSTEGHRHPNPPQSPKQKLQRNRKPPHFL